MLGSVTVEETLFFLKIAFLVLLYVFIWRVVRAASKDLRSPAESMIFTPQRNRKLRKERDHAVAARMQSGRLIVQRSPSLPEGSVRLLDSGAISVGRSQTADVVLEDEFASTRHARLETRKDGVWVVDTGSTNGTFVNGMRLTEPRKLLNGDTLRIGSTDFRYER